MAEPSVHDRGRALSLLYTDPHGKPRSGIGLYSSDKALPLSCTPLPLSCPAQLHAANVLCGVGKQSHEACLL